MVVLAADETWDVAVLRVGHGKDAEWAKPSSLPPVFAAVGSSAEPGCEAVGFPDSEVQPGPAGNLAAAVRQTEQAIGTLASAGQGKAPQIAGRTLPPRWMPLNVDSPTPGTQAGWGGMSGAGVVLPDGRLVGVVVKAEAGHQQRRLYVVPLADVLARSSPVAAALSAALGGPVAVEARDARLYDDVLQAECLGRDGLPILAGEADLGAFGVKAAGILGEPAFLDYVPRDGDQELSDSLQQAQATDRMLLVVGGSAGGKSRSAAQAARQLLGGYRLLCPKQTSLARLGELTVTDLGAALVWLDDAERYDGRSFRATVDWLLHKGVTVVATIRRTELEARMPRSDLRDPLGEALGDKNLVVEVDWQVIWNDRELARVSQHASYPPLLEWAAAGKSPGAWIVAGPDLVKRLQFAETDQERPARYALVRTVLDWYRTGIARPCPVDTAEGLLRGRLADDMEQSEIGQAIDDAFQWALESVIGRARKTSQALLTKAPSPEDGLTVHDYVQDADANVGGRVVPDDVWGKALQQATTDGARYSVGLTAGIQGHTGIAAEVFLPFARTGSHSGMFNLGVVLQDSDPGQARYWYEKAAAAGLTEAMTNLGALLLNSDPGQAQQWWEKAAEAGDTGAMTNLGVLLSDSDPGQARQWWEKAANAGNTDAMTHLGALLRGSDPGQARQWWEKAAGAGSTDAMTKLGALLHDSDPGQAQQWWRKAANTGDTGAMDILGLLFRDSDPGQARQWWEKAANAGNTDAMTHLGALLRGSDPGQARQWYQKAASAGDPEGLHSLGVLLHNSDPGQARQWYEKAASAGHTGAMYNLGVLLHNSDPGQARQWYERAAKAGRADAMYNLGLLVRDSDPGQAQQWWEKAAGAGLIEAMTKLGILLRDSDPGLARQWLEKAARAGDAVAMYSLGVVLYDSDPGQARQWWEKAADGGHSDAMYNLGNLLRDSDPGAAQLWWEKAATIGHSDAMVNLGVLLRDSDPGQARQWWEKAARTGDTAAMKKLGFLLQDSDPGQARQWLEKAARTGDTSAMYNLGALLHDSDPGQARQWYEKAANAGDTSAMLNLGVLLHDSDPGQARQWYEKAANAGHTGAMTKLGVLLHDSDPGQAQHWSRTAANAGHPDAMIVLGILLQDSDPAQAQQWLDKAVTLGGPRVLIHRTPDDPGASTTPSDLA